MTRHTYRKPALVAGACATILFTSLTCAEASAIPAGYEGVSRLAPDNQHRAVAYSGSPDGYFDAADIFKCRKAAKPPTTADLKNRKAIHHVHVDAAFVTYENGKLVIKTRVGKDAVDPKGVYLQLKKDTHNGRDVSKLTIPESGPEPEMLKFLGKPGETFWAAPGAYYPGWKPIWAGLAVDVPDSEIRPGTMKLTLDRVDGPSWIENIIYHGGDDPEAFQLLSSRDRNFKTLNMHLNDYHVHTTWVFGKPGVYRMVLTASGTTTAGKTIKSAPTEVYWQVG